MTALRCFFRRETSERGWGGTSPAQHPRFRFYGRKRRPDGVISGYFRGIGRTVHSGQLLLEQVATCSRQPPSAPGSNMQPLHFASIAARKEGRFVAETTAVFIGVVYFHVGRVD